MPTLEVFDPPMCCSTGVCGPGVDPALARFASDLEWAKNQGVEVQRYNLAQQPGLFLARAVVKSALNEHGKACLPMVLLDGKVVAQGTYPTREVLAEVFKEIRLERPAQDVPAQPTQARQAIPVQPAGRRCC